MLKIHTYFGAVAFAKFAWAAALLILKGWYVVCLLFVKLLPAITTKEASIMKVNAKEIGARIKKLRNQNEVTQDQLAEKLHIATNTLYRIETGLRVASLDLFIEIADYFEVTLDYLILGRKSSKDSLKEKIRELIKFLIKWLEDL